MIEPTTAGIGEIARHAQIEATQRAEIAKLTEEIERLCTAQITDGQDPRLTRFWEIAGENADDNDYCTEYDALVERLGGNPREHEYEITSTIDITVTVTTYINARTAEDACDDVYSLTEDNIDEALRNGDYSIIWDSREQEAERA